ncbi:MAG: hypothetical protein M1829_003974 [Trizodia sp. TS-e1964]|nr:MAG: hypothetical protein M1829_003974 [Trizodia sp. TS-e1964]
MSREIHNTVDRPAALDYAKTFLRGLIQGHVFPLGFSYHRSDIPLWYQMGHCIHTWAVYGDIDPLKLDGELASKIAQFNKQEIGTRAWWAWVFLERADWDLKEALKLYNAVFESFMVVTDEMVWKLIDDKPDVIFADRIAAWTLVHLSTEDSLLGEAREQ